MALAFAEIGFKPASFFNCLEKHADEFVARADEQAIANVSWSLAREQERGSSAGAVEAGD